MPVQQPVYLVRERHGRAGGIVGSFARLIAACCLLGFGALLLLYAPPLGLLYFVFLGLVALLRVLFR